MDSYFDLLYYKLCLPTATGHAQVSFLFFFFKMKFSSKKHFRKKNTVLISKKSQVFPLKKHTINNSFHDETEGLGLALYPMPPSKNE